MCSTGNDLLLKNIPKVGVQTSRKLGPYVRFMLRRRYLTKTEEARPGVMQAMPDYTRPPKVGIDLHRKMANSLNETLDETRNESLEEIP